MQYVPDYVPVVYSHDEELAITVIEDLSRLTITRKGLIDGEEYPLLSQHIGRFLAHVLFYTSDFGLQSEEKRILLTDTVWALGDTNDYEPDLQLVVDELWSDKTLKL